MAQDNISKALALLGVTPMYYMRAKYSGARMRAAGAYIKEGMQENTAREKDAEELHKLYSGLNTGLYTTAKVDDSWLSQAKTDVQAVRKSLGKAFEGITALQNAAYANLALGYTPKLIADLTATLQGVLAPQKGTWLQKALSATHGVSSTVANPLYNLAYNFTNINPFTMLANKAINWASIGATQAGLPPFLASMAMAPMSMLAWRGASWATSKLGQWLTKPEISTKKIFQLERIPIIAKYKTAEDIIDPTIVREVQHLIMYFRESLTPYEQLSLQLQAQIATSVATLPILTSEFLNTYIEKRVSTQRSYNRQLSGLENFLEGTSFNEIIREQSFRLKRGENLHTLLQNIGLALTEASSFMKKFAVLTNIPQQIGMVLSGKNILEEANKYRLSNENIEKLKKATYINKLGIGEMENFASAYMGLQQSSIELLASSKSYEEANINLLSGIYESSRVSALELATIRAVGFRIRTPINYNAIGRSVTEEYRGGLFKWLAGHIPGMALFYEAFKTGEGIFNFLIGKTKIGTQIADALLTKIEEYNRKQQATGNVLGRVTGTLADIFLGGPLRSALAPFLGRYNNEAYNLLASGYNYYRDTSLLERFADTIGERLNEAFGKLPIFKQLFYQENRISLRERRRIEWNEQVKSLFDEAAERIGLKQLEDQPLFYRYATTTLPKQIDLSVHYLSLISDYTRAIMVNTYLLSSTWAGKGVQVGTREYKPVELDKISGKLLNQEEFKEAQEDYARILAQAVEEIARIDEKSWSRLGRLFGGRESQEERIAEFQKGLEDLARERITREILTAEDLWQRQFKYSPLTGEYLNLEEYERENPISATARQQLAQYNQLNRSWYTFDKTAKVSPLQWSSGGMFTTAGWAVRAPQRPEQMEAKIEELRQQPIVPEIVQVDLVKIAGEDIKVAEAGSKIAGLLPVKIVSERKPADNTAEGVMEAQQSLQKVIAREKEVVKEKSTKKGASKLARLRNAMGQPGFMTAIAAWGLMGTSLLADVFKSSPEEELVEKLEQKGIVDHNYLGNSVILKWSEIHKLPPEDLKKLIDFDDWDEETSRRLQRIYARKKLGKGDLPKETQSTLEYIKKVEEKRKKELAIVRKPKDWKYSISRFFTTADEKTAQLLTALDNEEVIEWNTITGYSKILKYDELTKLDQKSIKMLLDYNDWDQSDTKFLRDLYNAACEQERLRISVRNEVQKEVTEKTKHLQKTLERVHQRRSGKRLEYRASTTSGAIHRHRRRPHAAIAQPQTVAQTQANVSVQSPVSPTSPSITVQEKESVTAQSQQLSTLTNALPPSVARLLNEIKQDEGWSPVPYIDPLGYGTVGYGTLLPLRNDEINQLVSLRVHGSPESIYPLRPIEGEYLLVSRLDENVSELLQAKPEIQNYPKEVQEILYNMAYNLGAPKLLQFRKMFAALDRGDYETAAKEMINSRWYTQVGNRAKRLVNKMLAVARTGGTHENLSLATLKQAIIQKAKNLGAAVADVAKSTTAAIVGHVNRFRRPTETKRPSAAKNKSTTQIAQPVVTQPPAEQFKPVKQQNVIEQQIKNPRLAGALRVEIDEDNYPFLLEKLSRALQSPRTQQYLDKLDIVANELDNSIIVRGIDNLPIDVAAELVETFENDYYVKKVGSGWLITWPIITPRYQSVSISGKYIDGKLFDIASMSKRIEAIEDFCEGIPGVSNQNDNVTCQKGGSLYNRYQILTAYLNKLLPTGPRAPKFESASKFGANLPLAKMRSKLKEGPLSSSWSMIDKEGALKTPFIDKAMEVLGTPEKPKKARGIIDLMKAEAERASQASSWFETKFEDVRKNNILMAGAEQRAVQGITEDQALIMKAQEALSNISETKTPENVQKLHEILEAIRELNSNSTALSAEQTKLLAALVSVIQSQDPELAAALGYGITDES